MSSAPAVDRPAGWLARADGLAAGYDGRPAIEGVGFTVSAGMRVGLLGPNGGGKTTLFRAMLGELRPMAGSLSVEASIATVPQTDRSRLDYPVTALDVARMGSLARLPWWRQPGRREREAARRALAEVGLAALAGRSFGELSGGQRQRVLIARALVAEARLLLLDEPFAGLDSPSARTLDELIDRLAAEGRGLIIATHDLEQARRWDRVICLNHRQIACGDPHLELSTPVLEATYGAQIVELPDSGGLGIMPAHHHGQVHDTEADPG